MEMKMKVLLVVLSLVVLCSSAEEELITKTCRTTPDIGICESALRSDPRSPSADTEGLILIIIDAVKSKFSDSLAYVNQLLKESSLPPAKADALNDCVRLLRVVIESNVGVAKSAVNLGDPKFGEDAMRDSAIEAGECQREVTGAVGDFSFESAFVKRMTFLKGLSNVAASLIKLLE